MGNRRVAIIGGLRTPFVKANTVFNDLTALDLGRIVVQELVQRYDLDPEQIDELVFGQVVPSMTASSIARELVLLSGLPRRIETHTVMRACATSIQATVDVARSITEGHAHVGIAGGTESMSDPPIFTSRPLAHALVSASKAKNLGARLKPFQRLKGRDLLPVPPAIAEYTTGMSMGDSAEKMAKENGISRLEQDQISLASHHNAARAWKAGYFKDEVMSVPVPPKYKEIAATDNLVREDTSLEALTALKPVFDRRYGTVTAGNASPLTDGAAALILMSEEKAKALGYEPLGFLKSYAFAATDPADQLLQGPAYAAPIALDRAGMKLSDIELIDMHEAFAAQIASNIQAFGSKAFAQKIGRKAPLGEVNRERLNVNGGSIALGHPFAATGARILHQSLREMKRRNLGTALVTVCAQGGQGAAVVLERA
ncbi:MAG: acetyl-CoA C-acyltransferase FadI [Archangium sp.]|nr:acetyl-CoA C-acyltransferase FadI [Archangium sp.]MDP3152536.1 acetyl-CoA C-acyltransferase FadI [Archangium sp.]MDP3572294.1 acetyl-CoA C-acyltransferase FadI [Archangium sp.]